MFYCTRQEEVNLLLNDKSDHNMNLVIRKKNSKIFFFKYWIAWKKMNGSTYEMSSFYCNYLTDIEQVCSLHEFLVNSVEHSFFYTWLLRRVFLAKVVWSCRTSRLVSESSYTLPIQKSKIFILTKHANNSALELCVLDIGAGFGW